MFPSFTKTFHHSKYEAIDELQPKLSSKGKVIVITGGARGVGKATAISFALSGAKAVVVTSRSKSTLDQTLQELEAAAATTKRESPIIIKTVVADILDSKAINDAFAQVKAEIGPIDVLVANAGYLPAIVSVEKQSLEDFSLGLDVNIKALLIVVQAFLKTAAENATLINVSSAVVHAGTIPGNAGYAVSKTAGTKLIEYVEAENPNLRVFQVHPGTLYTDMAIKALASMPGLKAEDELSMYNIFRSYSD
jgi:NAD(P)-dependent dehydrogenase (short-subunit alcohol dehydrogenase family)